MHHTKAGRRPHTPKQRPAIYLSNTALKSAGSASLKNAGSGLQGARCRRARCGPLAYWSTLGIAHGAFFATSPVENTAPEVLHPLKRRFSGARRTEPMCTGVHEAPWNAAPEVLHHSTRPSRARQGRLRGSSPSAHVPWPKPPRPLQPRCCRRCRRRHAPRRSQRACRR